MAAKKYVEINVTGALHEVAGTVTGGTSGEDGMIVALGTTGKLDMSIMPTGIGADTRVMTTSENLTAGDFVNVYDVTGTPTARKATAAAIGTRAHGFVKASTTSGNDATVYFEGTNDSLTGLTAGIMYFLSDITAGTATDTPPTTATHILQVLGIAVDDDAINVEVGDSIIRA